MPLSTPFSRIDTEYRYRLHHYLISSNPGNPTVVRNVGSGATLVNGAAVSVHALRHGDELSLGGRRLRWEYDHPPRRQGDPLPQGTSCRWYKVRAVAGRPPPALGIRPPAAPPGGPLAPRYELSLVQGTSCRWAAAACAGNTTTRRAARGTPCPKVRAVAGTRYELSLVQGTSCRWAAAACAGNTTTRRAARGTPCPKVRAVAGTRYELSLGGRRLRWEYDHPPRRQGDPLPQGTSCRWYKVRAVAGRPPPALGIRPPAAPPGGPLAPRYELSLVQGTSCRWAAAACAGSTTTRRAARGTPCPKVRAVAGTRYELSLGGRRLRWEYDHPPRRQGDPLPQGTSCRWYKVRAVAGRPPPALGLRPPAAPPGDPLPKVRAVAGTRYELSLGGRRLRWEYDHPPRRQGDPLPQGTSCRWYKVRAVAGRPPPALGVRPPAAPPGGPLAPRYELSLVQGRHVAFSSWWAGRSLGGYLGPQLIRHAANVVSPMTPVPAGGSGGGGARAARRGTLAAAPRAPDRELQLALELKHRASMPGQYTLGAGGGGARAARRGTLAAAPRAPDRELQLALELKHRASMPGQYTLGAGGGGARAARRGTLAAAPRAPDRELQLALELKHRASMPGQYTLGAAGRRAGGAARHAGGGPARARPRAAAGVGAEAPRLHARSVHTGGGRGRRAGGAARHAGGGPARARPRAAAGVGAEAPRLHARSVHTGGGRGRRAGGAARHAGGGPRAPDRELQLALELKHRASMPGQYTLGAGGGGARAARRGTLAAAPRAPDRELQLALELKHLHTGAGGGGARAARRGTLAAAPRAPDRELQLALELKHRASMPGQYTLGAGGGGARAARRGTLAAAPRAPDRELQLALELKHRASMPGQYTLGAGGGGARAARRGTLAAAPRAPDRELQLALELKHRASMPASSTGGKQVAIVQPQRRDTSNQNDLLNRINRLGAYMSKCQKVQVSHCPWSKSPKDETARHLARSSHNYLARMRCPEVTWCRLKTVARPIPTGAAIVAAIFSALATILYKKPTCARVSRLCDPALVAKDKRLANSPLVSPPVQSFPSFCGLVVEAFLLLEPAFERERARVVRGPATGVFAWRYMEAFTQNAGAGAGRARAAPSPVVTNSARAGRRENPNLAAVPSGKWPVFVSRRRFDTRRLCQRMPRAIYGFAFARGVL
ncbi:hypothetical protein MSG28_014362 [Choristoneura fumiferana]|uniref:Uncharacterized protein n=1 Tax=Choristoneura fumiferana TaxID=7141 RepID=A0ACC0JGZ2_CHOFU|nr:hypothetical protein MSG28_014362 [Choristoneura fumiferana]